MDVYAPLRPIMERCQTQLSESEFHAAVNVTFHRFESEEYDEGHQDMWQSLPRQFALLTSDLEADAARQGIVLPERIRLLDIGCGTGLATDCLLGTALGKRVSDITLLDTSKDMMARAKARSANWGRPVRMYEMLLDGAPLDTPFDLVITSSVLHHVPDLPAFFVEVARRQNANSYFLHVQDPNGDAMGDAGFAARRTQYEAAVGKQSNVPEWLARLHPRRVAGRLWREITNTQGQDCASRAIRELHAQGVTPKPLTVLEVYRITDLHVNDGVGISLDQLRSWISGYELVRARTYGFFGVLESDLPPELREQERRLSEAGDLTGGHIGALWRRS